MLAEIFAYIEKRYTEPISLKEVAATVNLSPGYLTTAIKERTGHTVVEWTPSGAWRRHEGCSSRPTRAWSTSAPA